MVNKIFFISFLCSFVGVIGYFVKDDKQISIASSNDKIFLKLHGAFIQEKIIAVKKGTFLKKALWKNIDYSSCDTNFLKSIANNILLYSQDIYIPYSENKIKKKPLKLFLKDEFILKKLKIYSSITNKLKSLFEKNKLVNWEKIKVIKGVGEKTLLKLKKYSYI